MPELTRKEDPGKRLVLGFDGGCMACGELARRIEARLAGRLEVLSLHEPRVVAWRKKTLGEGAPLVPTLFEVRGLEAVRAWTGWRLGFSLGRALGPAAAWEVMQALGEAREVEEPSAVTALTRGQFLKGVGGAAVAMSVMSSTDKFISLAGAAQAEESTVLTEGDEAVGASVVHPAEWSVEREEQTFDDTYGFTLWKPKSGSSRGSRDHGGTPTVRVARARRLRPEQIESRVRAKLDEYSDLPVKRQKVSVGQKKFEGVAVGPIPGSTPSTEVYVPVEGRVYQINVYGEKLDAEGRRLLSRLRFGPPSRSVESLGLPDAGDPEAFRKEDDEQLIERERSARAAGRSARAEQEAVLERSAQSDEVRLDSGCWRAPSWFFFQTQHGPSANKRGYWAKYWGASWPGWTRIGIPNYWGQYTHGDYGYGRCFSEIYTNDMFAIDYPLGKGDIVFSPFEGGTVTFAGRNYTHKNYGIFVVIEADNGKYVSMSAHLNSLASGIRRGARVTEDTVIGYAGKTGDPSIPVGPPHLHQAFYRYPRYNPDGSPYGGAALQVIYHRYFGTAAGTGPGVYKFGWRSKSTVWAKGDWISN